MKRAVLTFGAFALGTALSVSAMAAGSAGPQLVDTTGLQPLGEEWVAENPYRGDPLAIEIGASGYNQNCARCHGLEGISGGIAPDIRFLEPDADGDEWFVERVKNGSVREGRVYMPKFAEVLGQEALWAIRAYLETKYNDE